MDGKSEVLMHADVAPPDPPCVWIARVVGLHPALTTHAPFVTGMVEADGCHDLPLTGIGKFPPPHVVAAGDDAGADALRDPGLDDEVADLCLDPNQCAGLDTEARGI